MLWDLSFQLCLSSSKGEVPDVPCCEQGKVGGTSNTRTERTRGNKATVLLSVHDTLQGQFLEKKSSICRLLFLLSLCCDLEC